MAEASKSALSRAGQLLFERLAGELASILSCLLGKFLP
jgi:hypothetical protein